MKRGPSPSAARNGDDLTMVEKAREAWGSPAPDWIEELARLADDQGLRAAGKAIDYSASTVSEVIRGVFRGAMARVEGKVRGALMGLVVDCPVLGEIGRNQCLSEQARPFSATNSTRARLRRACRGGCPHARNGGDDA